jgi:hypothetical protein
MWWFVRQSDYEGVRDDLQDIRYRYGVPKTDIGAQAEMILLAEQEGFDISDEAIRQGLDWQTYSDALKKSNLLASFGARSPEWMFGLRMTTRRNLKQLFLPVKTFVNRVHEIESDSGPGTYFSMAMTTAEREKEAEKPEGEAA